MAMTSFGLVTKEVAGGVDAIHADVVQRAASQPFLRPNVPVANGQRERRVEELGNSDAAFSHEVDDVQGHPLEMQPIRDHHLHAMLAACVDHRLTFLDRHSHRLLAEHVDAGTCRPNGIFCMHRVRQRDVHGIEARQALLEIVVRKQLVDPIFPAQRLELAKIVADERSHARVAGGMRKCRQHGDLSDVPKSDYSVAHWS
jgi:hypothetical protein